MIYWLDNEGVSISKLLPSHVGHKIEHPRMYSKLDSVQADGHELELCLAILGRTSCSNRVHTFVGDDAREILLNWR